MIALYFSDFATFFAITGISNAPGTQTMSMSFSFTPCLLNSSIAPDNNFEPINSLNL